MASRFRTVGLIAALFLMTAPNLWAGKIEVRQLGNFLLEVSGGSGASAWHIRYGTQFHPAKFKTLEGPGSTAYFSHYNWLRRIDTVKGMVTGRWMFPGQAITELQWKDDKVQIEVNMNGNLGPQVLRTYDFDPKVQQAPPANQMYADASQSEVIGSSFARDRVIKAADAEKALPERENAVRRDPLSPWLRIGLGRGYAILGRPESAQTIDEGIRIESAHYSELLDIANYLEEINQHEAAKLAFERGYAEFWRQGQDPRLVSAALVLGSVKASPAVQRELATRAFAMNPWADGAAQAWEVYGKWLTANGESKEGALWLERAKDARENGLTISYDGRYSESLAASLVRTTLLAGAVFYTLVLYFHYRPQRRARLDAERAAGVSRAGFFNVEYWRRSERLAFLLLVAIAWLADGFAGAALRDSSSFSLRYLYQMRTGMLLAFNSIQTLDAPTNRNPERDLLLAIAYQRDRQPAEAEKLYRSLPQFAESWNNLGVLLKNSGESEESRSAFERALELKPEFPEAEWNLGRPARGEWVKAHERYVPDKAMMTVPSREQVLRAYGVKGRLAYWTSILNGPLNNSEVDNFNRPEGRLRSGFLIFLAAGALILIFVRPREVQVAPPKYQVILELLFPGTARIWGALGGILLGVACYFSSALWPLRWTRFYIYYSFASNVRRFPLPLGSIKEGVEAISSPVPSFWWLVVLLAVNAAVVLLWKWRRK